MTNLNKNAIDVNIQKRAIDKVSNGELQENSKVFYSQRLTTYKLMLIEVGACKS